MKWLVSAALGAALILTFVGCSGGLPGIPDTTGGITDNQLVGSQPSNDGSIDIDAQPNGTSETVVHLDFSGLFPVEAESAATRSLYRFPALDSVDVSVENESGQTMVSATATKQAPTVEMNAPIGTTTQNVRIRAIGRDAAGTEISRAVSNLTTAVPGTTLVANLRLANTLPAITNLVPTSGASVSANFTVGVSITDLAGSGSVATTFYMNGSQIDGSQVGTNPQVAVTGASVGIVDLRAVSVSPSGGQNEVSWQVTVASTPPTNQSPTASMSISPNTGEAPLPVNFNGSASNDPDGSIVSYAWNFGDGSSLVDGPSIGHTYQGAGTYAVTLTVTDDDGATASTTGQVLVSQTGIDENNPPNVVAVIGPFSGTVPLTVTVDASGSSDPDGDTIVIGIDWGNGTTSTGLVASYTYTVAGSYTVTVTVTDSRGGVGTTSATIVVNAPSSNQSPTASIAVSPTSGIAPLAVSFNGSASSDSDGSIASYAWDFGDGDEATGSSVSHTYQVAGTFTATLTVTDDDGAMDATTALVVVSEPTVSVRPELSGWVGKVVTFSGGTQLGYDSVIVTVVTPPNSTESTVDVFLTTAPSSSLELTGTVDLTTAQFVGGWGLVRLDGSTAANPGGSTGLWQYNDSTGHLAVANVTAYANGVSASGAISADVSAVQDY